MEQRNSFSLLHCLLCIQKSVQHELSSPNAYSTDRETKCRVTKEVLHVVANTLLKSAFVVARQLDLPNDATRHDSCLIRLQ
jgi:hypothetical protein